MFRYLFLSLMIVSLWGCDDDDPHVIDDAAHHDTLHDHDATDDATDDVHEHGDFCTSEQINECTELGAGAGCCESTDSCFVPPCAPECCPVIE